MEFLGNLGIDVKLLVAQIINFGLLLWLLTKFIYKPIIKRIEKDEKELKQAQIQNKELEQEKEDFAEQRKKEIAEIKKRTKEIIKEAKNISQTIKKEAHTKAEKDALLLINQTKEKLELLKPEIEGVALKRVHAGIGDSFRKSFTSAISLSSQEELQDIFWKDFIEQVQELTLKKIKVPNMADIAKKEKKEELLKKIVTKKIGFIILEYVHPINTKQEKKLAEIISEKIGFEINITKKQNENLINGFRFEIKGMIIENNLLNIINDVKNFQK